MEFIIADMMAKLQKSETFGGRLTEAREEAERWDGNGIGYTQGELADLLRERCGVEIGRSYISELERSWKQDKMPSLEVARALASVLRVNLAWLAGVSSNKDPEDAAADLAWQPTTNTISNIIDLWTEDQRQMLLAVIKALAPYMASDNAPDAGEPVADAGEQEKLNRLLSSPGANDENGSEPAARPKRHARR